MSNKKDVEKRRSIMKTLLQLFFMILLMTVPIAGCNQHEPDDRADDNAVHP